MEKELIDIISAAKKVYLKELARRNKKNLLMDETSVKMFNILDKNIKIKKGSDNDEK